MEHDIAGIAVLASTVLVLGAVLAVFVRAQLAKPSCPRCGGREWIPLPHVGRFVVYCRDCCYTVDRATGRRA